MTPFIVCVSGGSGSGKTTFAKRIQQYFSENVCQILAQDNYYRDQSAKFDHDGGSVNFDHPDALEFSLMGEHLIELKKSNPVEVPIYDFATHTRQKETIHFKPSPLILVDGILVLSQPIICDNCDLNIFISCAEKLRYERRLNRDVKERGRTPDGVKAQFDNQVKPMHDEFVESSKKYAQIIVSESDFDKKLEEVCELLKSKI